MSKYAEASECLLSQYICDKLQIDYMVEIGRNIVHKILVILEKYFAEEMDPGNDLSKRANCSDPAQNLLVVGGQGPDPGDDSARTRE